MGRVTRTGMIGGSDGNSRLEMRRDAPATKQAGLIPDAALF
ncbi:hypothetical protein [Roseateles sp.]